MFPGSSPITSPGLVRKALLTEVRALPSPGVTQVRQYYDPLPVPAEPPSLAKALELILRPNGGSPTPPDPLPCMPCPLPRWIEPVPLSGSSRLVPPSPLRRRVGIHDFTCEACSAFTPVTACRVARPPKSGLCHKASAQSVAGLKPLVSYQTYRLLSGWDFHPQVICALGAHSGVLNLHSSHFLLPLKSLSSFSNSGLPSRLFSSGSFLASSGE